MVHIADQDINISLEPSGKIEEAFRVSELQRDILKEHYEEFQNNYPGEHIIIDGGLVIGHSGDAEEACEIFRHYRDSKFIGNTTKSEMDCLFMAYVRDPNSSYILPILAG